jgi:hypothetical protein
MKPPIETSKNAEPPNTPNDFYKTRSVRVCVIESSKSIGGIGGALGALAQTGARCSCGSTKTTDFPIHKGASVRRDCAACGKFICFPVWYGAETA